MIPFFDFNFLILHFIFPSFCFIHSNLFHEHAKSAVGGFSNGAFHIVFALFVIQ